jgi:hypothetical protein
MFGPGLGEYLTLILDPVIAVVFLRRWGFRMAPTAAAWFVVTLVASGLVGLFIGLIGMSLPRGAGVVLWTPVLLLGLAGLIVPRAMLLRSVSTSPSFRDQSGRPLSWGWGLLISFAALALALLLAGAIAFAGALG